MTRWVSEYDPYVMTTGPSITLPVDGLTALTEMLTLFEAESTRDRFDGLARESRIVRVPDGDVSYLEGFGIERRAARTLGTDRPQGSRRLGEAHRSQRIWLNKADDGRTTPGWRCRGGREVSGRRWGLVPSFRSRSPSSTSAQRKPGRDRAYHQAEGRSADDPTPPAPTPALLEECFRFGRTLWGLTGHLVVDLSRVPIIELLWLGP